MCLAPTSRQHWSQLFQEGVPFLGHIVSASGVGADPAKCQQVRDWPVPRDLHEVRSFVGLCSYFRRHIYGFTELATPLYELATKGRNEAFNELKATLTSAPILGFPWEDGPWYLDTDASDVGTGAVLSQARHCVRQQVVGGERGTTGGGTSPQTFQMLSLRAENHSENRQ